MSSRRAPSVWLSLGLALQTLALPNAQAAPESSIKAAYMLLFTRYVEWPNAAFADPKAPIVICVAGSDPFGSVLDETTQDQQSQNRELSVLRLARVEEAAPCHLIYISPMEAGLQQRWVSMLARRPVLTVTDDRSAFESGAVLWFVRESNGGRVRIRFEVSLPAAQRAGLKVSSQMLIAARRVHRGDGV